MGPRRQQGLTPRPCLERRFASTCLLIPNRALHASSHLNCPCRDALRPARVGQRKAFVASSPKRMLHTLTQDSRFRSRCIFAQDARSVRRTASRSPWASPRPEPPRPAGPQPVEPEPEAERPGRDRFAPARPGMTGGEARDRDSGDEGYRGGVCSIPASVAKCLGHRVIHRKAVVFRRRSVQGFKTSRAALDWSRAASPAGLWCVRSGECSPPVPRHPAYEISCWDGASRCPTTPGLRIDPRFLDNRE